MKPLEIILVDFLVNCFSETAAKKDKGTLVSEVDISVDGERKRIADLAYFNREQILSLATGGKDVPVFVIEILSKSELFEEIEKKLQDYFDAGVKLVWYISPNFKRIYAYTPNKLVQIFAAGDVATAAPVLPDFKIDIDKLFTIA